MEKGKEDPQEGPRVLGHVMPTAAIQRLLNTGLPILLTQETER